MVRLLVSVVSASFIREMPVQTVSSPLYATAREQKRRHVAMVAMVSLWLLVPSIRLMAAEPIILGPELERLPLGPRMDILEDKAKQWTMHDLVSEQGAGLFTPSHAVSPAFGFTSSAYWIRFSVVNPLDREIQWCLEVAYPPMDSIALYLPTQADQFQMRRAGDLLPFHTREVNYKDFIFLLRTAPQSQQTYYMRFENAGPMNLPLTILSPSLTVRPNLEVNPRLR